MLACSVTLYIEQVLIYLLKNLTNIRRKTVNLPTLESMHVSEKLENVYAQIIAEEDIKESYGQEAIVQKRLYISRQHIL